jgi:hypothetical protein
MGNGRRKDVFDKPCNECGVTIHFVKVDDKWKAYQPGTTTLHWLVCQSEEARQMRIRAGREAYMFPVSPSSIGDYRDCPRFFLFRNFKRLKALGLISPYLEEQVLAHFPDIPDGSVMPDIRAGHLGKACHVYFAARLRGKSVEEAKEIAKAEGIPLEFWRDWQIMTSIFESQLEAGMWDTKDASIEDRLTYEWKEGQVTVQLMVVIDLWRIINERSLSTDWKTGRVVEGEAGLAQDIQAGTNVLVIQRQLPHLKGGRFEQVQLRYKGDEPVGVDFTERDLDTIELALRSEVQQILNDREFIPNPYCQVCPPGAHPMVSYPITVGSEGEVQLRVPQTREEAEKIAALILAARRIDKAATDALRPFCDVHGEVGGFAHYITTERHLVGEWSETIPGAEGEEPVLRKLTGVERLKEILTQRGYAAMIPELVKADGTKLRSILTAKKYASLAADIRPLLVETEKPKFEHRSKPVTPQATVKQLPKPPEALTPHSAATEEPQPRNETSPDVAESGLLPL